MIAVTRIAQRIESGRRHPTYTRRFDADAVAAGEHRNYVGGRWEAIGRLQLEFLRQQGLRPEHQLLDVGCGSFRAGRHFIDYLERGHYYGIDINPNIIEAGYDHELSAAQRAKLPTENLRATDRFDADFGVRFDVAIAQSVFTHIWLNQIRLCLYRIAKVLRPGGRFYTSFYEKPTDFPLDEIDRHLHTERNTYWYYRGDLEWAAGFSPWTCDHVGDWGHPRGQRMIRFTRQSDRGRATTGR